MEICRDDNGTQAYLAFGPHEGGPWLLPRGYADTSKRNPDAAPRGDGGEQRGTGGNRGNNPRIEVSGLSWSLSALGSGG